MKYLVTERYWDTGRTSVNIRPVDDDQIGKYMACPFTAYQNYDQYYTICDTEPEANEYAKRVLAA